MTVWYVNARMAVIRLCGLHSHLLKFGNGRIMNGLKISGVSMYQRKPGFFEKLFRGDTLDYIHGVKFNYHKSNVLVSEMDVAFSFNNGGIMIPFNSVNEHEHPEAHQFFLFNQEKYQKEFWGDLAHAVNDIHKEATKKN